MITISTTVNPCHIYCYTEVDDSVKHINEDKTMKHKKGVQTEIDASYLYAKLAEHESDSIIANVYRQMSDIERGHAAAIMKNDGTGDAITRPSWRARTLNLIGKVFGYNYVLGALMDTEKSISYAAIESKKQQRQSLTGTENNHVNVLRAILERQPSVTGAHLSKFERKHRSIGGNAIRAAVLGGNDGLVSNFSLVMGVAGATLESSSVALAGVAGLLAGALSMALGEWISVKSSQELYENQMQVEMQELETDPEGEMKEIALIYITKGIPEEQAQRMATDIIGKKSEAHALLVREELGINADELKGSAIEAAIYSFIFFSVGAIIPLLPFLFINGTNAIIISVVISALGLFIIGVAITLFTGKNFWFSGSRQVVFGLAAAAITYVIGTLVGT